MKDERRKPVKKLISFTYFGCPACGHLQASLSSTAIRNGEPIFECPKCHKFHTWTEYKEVDREVPAFLCETCGNYIHDIPDNWLADREILCPSCHKVITFGRPAVHVSKVRCENQDILKLSIEITSGVYVLQPRTRRGRLVLRYLNSLAQEEEKSFRRVRDVEAFVLLSRNKYLGYLTWDKRLHALPTIRQIFVVPEERRKGNATLLIQQFLGEICTSPDKDGRLFLIESPNKACLNLLVKLGYAKLEGGQVVGIKIGFVQGL